MIRRGAVVVALAASACALDLPFSKEDFACGSGGPCEPSDASIAEDASEEDASEEDGGDAAVPDSGVVACGLRADPLNAQVIFLLDGTSSMASNAIPSPECSYFNLLYGLTELDRSDRVRAALLGCNVPSDGALERFHNDRIKLAIITLGEITTLRAQFNQSFAVVAAAADALGKDGAAPIVEGLRLAGEHASSCLNRNNIAPDRPTAIVLITDGVEGGTGSAVFDFACGGATITTTTAGDAAAYLAGHDILCDVNGMQPVRVFTIGIDVPTTTAAAFLESIAQAGRGTHRQATRVRSIQEALMDVLRELVP